MLAATLLFFYLRKRPKGLSVKLVAVLACTRSNHRFCIPKRLCGESASGQHPIRIASSRRTSRVPVPLGSFSGGFSSTDGYVPVNEAHVRRLERRSTRRADHFPGALSVFIPITRVSNPCGETLASLSASVPSVQDSGFPLLLPFDLSRHRVKSTSRVRSKCP